MAFFSTASQMSPSGAGLVVPPPAVPTPSIPGDHRVYRRLGNGLTVITESMPVDAVNLSLWVNVGSAREPTPLNGITHFLEHMVFKGTDRLQVGEFERVTESCGAVTNAATSQDYTQFYMTCAPDHFRDLAPLQVDVVMNPALPAAEFERERRVVLEEIRRSEDNARRRFFRHVSTLGFGRSPYSRPVLGPPEVIEGMPVETMARFHRHHYRPENVTVIAIGNLPPDDLADAVIEGFDQRLGSLGSPAVGDKEDLRSPSPVPLPPFETIVRQDHEDPVLQQARLAMVWRGPGLTAPDQCNPLDVLSTILARGRTSRLVQELREELGLVNYVSASNLTYAEQGLFYVSAQLPEDNIEAVEACIRRHIERLRTEPVTPSELARVKTRVANSFIFGNETPSNRAGLYGYYETLMGDIHQGLQYPADIRSLTVEDLQAAAQRWLNPDAYGLVTVRPGDES